MKKLHGEFCANHENMKRKALQNSQFLSALKHTPVDTTAYRGAVFCQQFESLAQEASSKEGDRIVTPELHDTLKCLSELACALEYFTPRHDPLPKQSFILQSFGILERLRGLAAISSDKIPPGHPFIFELDQVLKRLGSIIDFQD